MALFGKSLEEKTHEAIEKLRAQFPGESIAASVSDKTVTLTGEVKDMDTKTRVMNAFNGLVETENTINQIRVRQAPAAAQPTFAPTAGPAGAPTVGGGVSQTRTHQVAKGESLSAIAKKYYGDGNDYMRIFNANKDILKDPDKIQVGQTLKIPM